MCNQLIDLKLMILFFPNNHKALKLGRTTDEYEIVYIRDFDKAYSEEEWALHSKGFINPQISLLFLIVKSNMETNFGLLFYMSPSYFTQFMLLLLTFIWIIPTECHICSSHKNYTRGHRLVAFRPNGASHKFDLTGIISIHASWWKLCADVP